MKNQPSLDDILIISRTFEEHLRNLAEVLDRLIAYNLKLELSKCEFLRTEILYLGHIISREGIKPDPDKVKDVANAAPLKTELRRFLGM